MKKGLGEERLKIMVFAVLAALTGLAAENKDDADRMAVRELADGRKVGLAEAEARAESMNVLFRRREFKLVWRAYSKVFGLARDVGKGADVVGVDELVRRYRFADRMRKFAATYGFCGDLKPLRDAQDAVVASYAKHSPGLCGSAEVALAKAAFAGAETAAQKDRPEVALLPLPAELRELPGTLTVLSQEVSDRIAVCTEDASLAEEGYVLSVTADGIAIRSATAAGRFYAVETLKQLVRRDDDEVLTFPCVEIRDAPRFGWRGAMLDESRHFFGKGIVKRLLDVMASYKFNVFHWHLTDNQGWRFPVLKRPDIAKTCSTRSCSENHKDVWDPFEDMDYGPFFYTEKDIRDVVAYATERHIRIVPEIDVPGHSAAVLRTHPEWSCFGSGDVFCIGNPETLKFLDDVFDSVVELFPGMTVHIGCDEVGKDNWKKCPKCQTFMKEHGLRDENELQSWVSAHVAKRLAKSGRRIAGWDELAFEGDIPENGVILEWRDGKHGGAKAVEKGHPCVLTPWLTSYFIGRQGIEEDPFHYGGPQWYGPTVSLKQVYRYDPLNGIPESGRHLVLGGQYCCWTECAANEAELHWKMWPRAFATAEIYWSPAVKRNWDDFLRRVRIHRPRLIRAHVNCAPLE